MRGRSPEYRGFFTGLTCAGVRQSAVIVAHTLVLNARISRTYMPSFINSCLHPSGVGIHAWHSCPQFNKLVHTGPSPLFWFTYKTRADGLYWMQSRARREFPEPGPGAPIDAESAVHNFVAGGYAGLWRRPAGFWSGEQTAAGPCKRRMALRYIPTQRTAAQIMHGLPTCVGGTRRGPGGPPYIR
jgi:hypothetical protein